MRVSYALGRFDRATHFAATKSTKILTTRPTDSNLGTLLCLCLCLCLEIRLRHFHRPVAQVQWHLGLQQKQRQAVRHHLRRLQVRGSRFLEVVFGRSCFEKFSQAKANKNRPSVVPMIKESDLGSYRV